MDRRPCGTCATMRGVDVCAIGSAWPAALLAPELEEELRQLIEAGPDLERDGVVEYRVRHIRDLALRHFGVDYSRSGSRDGCIASSCPTQARRSTPRPIQRPRRRLKKLAGMIEEIQQASRVPGTGGWFQDEAPVGPEGHATRRWAPRGSRPRRSGITGFKSAYLFGAVCPDRDLGVAVVLSRARPEDHGLLLAK